MNLTFLVLTVSLALGINLFFFLIANTFKTDKLTDFTYGLTFIILALLYLSQSEFITVAQLLLTGMICIWAVRLITYLVIRIMKIKKDARFDEMRKNSLDFLKFWLGQGFAAWVILIPSSLLLSGRVEPTNSIVSYFGIFVWLIGLLIESIADQQKFTFKNKKGNKNKWINTGLWKYSRHPNYFGEILLWWGVFIFVLPSLSGLQYLSIIGPLFIMYILIFVSGIPPLEKRYKEKFKNNEAYQKYNETTSVLVPLPKLQ